MWTGKLDLIFGCNYPVKVQYGRIVVIKHSKINYYYGQTVNNISNITEYMYCVVKIYSILK